MLVLTRNIGETIVINNNIKIRITGIQRGQVRMAIDAPKDIPVNREEVQRRIDSEGVFSRLFQRS